MDKTRPTISVNLLRRVNDVVQRHYRNQQYLEQNYPPSRQQDKNRNEKIKRNQLFYTSYASSIALNSYGQTRKNFFFRDTDKEVMLSVPEFTDYEFINYQLKKRKKLRELLKILEILAIFGHNGFCIIDDESLMEHTGMGSSGLYLCLKDLKKLRLIDTVTSTRSPNRKFRAMRVIRCNRVYIEFFRAGYMSRTKFTSHYLYVLQEWHSQSLHWDNYWLLTGKDIPSPLKWVTLTHYRISEEDFKLIYTNKFTVQSPNITLTEPFNHFRADSPSIDDFVTKGLYIWTMPDQYLIKYYLRYHIAHGIPLPGAVIKYPWYIQRELESSPKLALELLDNPHCQSILFGKEPKENEDEEPII